MNCEKRRLYSKQLNKLWLGVKNKSFGQLKRQELLYKMQKQEELLELKQNP